MRRSALVRLAIVLGTSAAALEELEQARAFLDANGFGLHVVCINDAMRLCPVKPVAFATIHSKTAPRKFLDGVDASSVLMFTRRGAPDFPSYVVKARWLGTSGLYGVQIALEELKFDGVILAGVPIDAAAGTLAPEHSHMTDASKVETYKPEWLKALPEIGARTRSMSGWTRDLLGAPTEAWLEELRVMEPKPA